MNRVFVLLIFISASSAGRAQADSELPKGFFETKDRFEQLQFIERLTIQNISIERGENSSEEIIAETPKPQKLTAVAN